MEDLVKLVECPRDAWQGLPLRIPAQAKATYLSSLVDSGFRHIDAVSFVSPTAVPQMADSEDVLKLLNLPDTVEIIGIVVNQTGVDRAIATQKVSTIGFPYSISSEFLRRNQKQTLEESFEVLESVAATATGARLNLVTYISMAFGNPYGEPWSIDEVLNACELLADSGITQISLADTVGVASAQVIAETLRAATDAFPHLEIGAHLHAAPTDSAARIRAAYHAGCRRFDCSIGGLGGCPFAQDALVGNIPTEIARETLLECGAQLPMIHSLDALIQESRNIASHSRGVQR